MGKNSYLYRQPDFDGMVLFYELNGTLVNGWKYTNGKITGCIAPKIIMADDDKKNSSDSQTRGWVEDCYTDYIYESEEVCEGDVDIEYDDEFGATYVYTYSCWDESYVTSVEVCDTYWEDDGDDDSDSTWDDDEPIGGSNTSCGNDNNNTDDDPPSYLSLAEKQKILNQTLADLQAMGVDLSGVQITIVGEGCRSNARVTMDYNNIHICNSFFDKLYTQNDRIAILWHEKNHLLKDDRSWVSLENASGIEPFFATPPDDIADCIRYIMENKYGITEYIYDDQYGEYYKNPSWDHFYVTYLLIDEFVNSVYSLNEINNYREEIETMTNVSKLYDAERRYELWRNEEIYGRITTNE